ncbi:MAG: cupin domain-containing protein [Verrucomicrobiota bacterium]|nr:cupin domain-containing protein [Verrucomicrobiota bacterium]
MLKLSPENVSPKVEHSNYFKCDLKQTKWGPRIIKDIELILIVEGIASYCSEKTGKLLIGAGDILFIPPGEEHVFEVNTKEKTIISCIHLELLNKKGYLKQDYIPDPLPKNLTDTKGDLFMHELFHRIADIFTKNSLFREIMLTTASKELWLRLNEFWSENYTPITSPRVSRMIDFLKANY